MASIDVKPSLQFFTDKDGSPLDAGFIYVGEENQNPETHPIATYWDLELTQPAPQPLRTIGGYISRQGSPANIFVAQNYSIVIRNKMNEFISYRAAGSGDNLRDDLASSNGSSLVGYDNGTAQDVLDDSKPLEDYAALRAYAGRATGVQITGADIAGTFRRHGTSGLTDNGGTVIIDSLGRIWERSFSGDVELSWWGVSMAGGDATAAFIAAVAIGRDIHVSAGWCVTDPIEVPQKMIGKSIYGGGYAHWNADNGHTIKARTLDQAHIFYMAAGTDNVTFSGLRIDGDGKAKRGINAQGGFINVLNCGVYGCKEYGFDSSAGLNRIAGSYFKNIGVGARLFSDSHVTDSEFSGGTTPVVLAAGGNRLVNSLMNSGSTSCLRIENFDATTNNANTDIIGCYIGETYSGLVEKPVIEIYGSASRKIRDVRFVGGFIISGEVPATGGKINGLIRIDNANGITFTGVGAAGVGYFATADVKTTYFINATNSDNVNVLGCIVKGFNGAPIVLGNGMGTVGIGGGTIFDGWQIGAAGVDLPAINHSSGFVSVKESTFVSSDSNPYMLKTFDAAFTDVLGPELRYSSVTIINATTGIIAGIWKRAGSQHPHIQRASVRDLVFSALPSAPASPSYGQMYLDGNLGKLRIYLASGWENLN